MVQKGSFLKSTTIFYGTDVNEALPPKLVRVTRFEFDLPPKKGEVFARLSTYRVFQLDMTYFEVPDGQLKLTSKFKKR